MTQRKRRLVERITDAEYLEGLESIPLDRLREMRDECREGENELSFERRLCQARIEIISAEIDHRNGRSDRGLLERLPEILASESRSGTEQLPSRAPDFSVPRNADIPRRRVEEIVGEQTLARLAQVSLEELKSVVGSLADHEKEVSAKRKDVQEVMDKIQAEIVRRYVSGEADPSAARH